MLCVLGNCEDWVGGPNGPEAQNVASLHYVTLGLLLYLSEPRFSHQKSGEIHTACFLRALCGLGKM